MSTTYRLKGRRHLRMYTAPNLTPSTAAGSDVAAISDRLCEVPWTAAPLDSYPSFPTYATAKVDENASARECFDAAEWCAGHDESKRHRAYAQAAIYRYALPEAVHALTVESVTVKVTCDPYTPQGARIAAMVTDSDDLPSECALVRTMSAHEDGVAQRTSVVNESTGAVTWYETSETRTLALGATGGKWLLVFVGLEDYRARNGWLEGAAKIDSVSATLSGEVDGWDEGTVVDLRVPRTSSVALEGGSSPTWLQPLNMLAAVGSSASAQTLSRTVYQRTSDVNHVWRIDLKAKYDPATRKVSIYGQPTASYLSVDGTGVLSDTGKNVNVELSIVKLAADASVGDIEIPAATDVYNLGLTAQISSSQQVKAGSLLYPYISEDGDVKVLVFGTSYGVDGITASASHLSPVDFGKIEDEDFSRDASESVRAGTSSDEALGDMSWQIATMDVGTGSRTPGDTFGHILSLSREVGDGVAHDYAFSAKSFPLSDMDRVTVVPRFARAKTVPAGQAAISQPGLSLWYHKEDNGVSFIQGSLLVLRATSDGTTLRLTALAPVANTGVSIRLAVWRSSGVAWEGSAGFHTAQQLVKTVGFVDASEASVTAPGHQFTDGDFAGLPPIGGVTADRIGMSSEIAGALSSGDQIEIRLDPAVSTGDVLIIAPVPVGLSPTASGNDAHFGRQSDPSAETTKSWCRYTANLGWFPKIEVM